MNIGWDQNGWYGLYFLAVLMNPEKKRRIAKVLSLIVIIAAISVIIGWIFDIGVIVGLIGAMAVVGYIINAPNLYYYIEGVNSAIACHRAALFMVLGIGFICL